MFISPHVAAGFDAVHKSIMTYADRFVNNFGDNFCGA